MRCGDEENTMHTGELWWFDNKEVHEARNDGTTDRVHLIFDLEPRSGILLSSRSELKRMSPIPAELDANRSA
jgi:quercetin dioxygenase-like cupin family protein